MDPYPQWETTTPDQIERDVVESMRIVYHATEGAQEIALETIREFRRELSKNGYVFYQP